MTSAGTTLTVPRCIPKTFQKQRQKIFFKYSVYQAMPPPPEKKLKNGTIGIEFY